MVVVMVLCVICSFYLYQTICGCPMKNDFIAALTCSIQALYIWKARPLLPLLGPSLSLPLHYNAACFSISDRNLFWFNGVQCIWKKLWVFFQKKLGFTVKHNFREGTKVLSSQSLLIEENLLWICWHMWSVRPLYKCNHRMAWVEKDHNDH